MKKALFTDCQFSDKDINNLKKIGVEVIKEKGYLGEEELIKKLQDCSIYIIGGADKASEKVINSTNLELIVFYGTGWENYVDIKAANNKHIPIANTPKANAYTVAEHAVALVLDAVKQITYLNNTTKNGKWIRRQSWNLEKKTLGIVGMGTIGGFVAKILHNAFKMNVLYVSRNSKTDIEKDIGAKKVHLNDLMKKSDVIAVTASYCNETVNMLSKEQFDIVKTNAVLICTSRAELVEPEALKNALNSNKLATAAFDSYYKEPTPPKNNDKWGLLSLPDNKFIVTPHTAYGSKEAMENMNSMVTENIKSYLDSGKPTYSVNL
jgi:phosphoglycerate dehydrogenase-like enzyme